MRLKSPERTQRRKRLADVTRKLELAVRERDQIGNEYIAPMEITDAIYHLLQDNLWADRKLQTQWNRFQKLQAQITVLREVGGKMIALREDNAATSGKYIQKIRENQPKNYAKG